jgi:hypothetical protein
MYIGCHIKYPLFLSNFNETSVPSIDFQKTELSNFMKIHPVAAKSFHADEQTEKNMAEANSCFSQFCKCA